MPLKQTANFLLCTRTHVARRIRLLSHKESRRGPMESTGVTDSTTRRERAQKSAACVVEEFAVRGRTRAGLHPRVHDVRSDPDESTSVTAFSSMRQPGQSAILATPLLADRSGSRRGVQNRNVHDASRGVPPASPGRRGASPAVCVPSRTVRMQATDRAPLDRRHNVARRHIQTFALPSRLYRRFVR